MNLSARINTQYSSSRQETALHHKAINASFATFALDIYDISKGLKYKYLKYQFSYGLCKENPAKLKQP